MRCIIRGHRCGCRTTQAERLTVSQNTDRLTQQFDELVELYSKILYWGRVMLPPSARLQTIHEFNVLVENFAKLDRRRILYLLRRASRSSESIRADTAVRLLYALNEFGELEELSQLVLSGTALTIRYTDEIKLLSKFPPPESKIEGLIKAYKLERGTLVSAVLRNETHFSWELLKRLIDDELITVQEITEVARWKNKDGLRQIVEAYRDVTPIPGYTDVVVKASFHLALDGDENNLNFLKQSIYSESPLRAANATRELARLALPDAIRGVKRVLLQPDTNALETAVSAAGVLKSAALIPELLYAATQKVYSEFDSSVPICDNAIRVLRHILESWEAGQGQQEEYEEDRVNYYLIFTDRFRNRMIEHYRSLSKGFDSKLRYCEGRPLTIKMLVDDLICGSYESDANDNHRAITGEDSGFDPNEDAVTNLPAIERWIERAKDPAPIMDGGWAFMGEAIQYP